MSLKFSLLAAIAAVSIFAGAAQAADDQVPRTGGTLIAVLDPEPQPLVSIVNNNYPQAIVSANVFDGLLQYDDKFNPRPGLAESWDIAPDGLSIRFHLRKGVKWHDGTDFTSEDVRFSVMELWRKYHSRGRSTFSAVSNVETPDADTAIFTLTHPSLVILSALSASESPVLPAHLYAGKDFLTNPWNSKPIGTGPFVFSKWEKGQFVELKRNDNYWDKGKPYLNKVIFRTIPDASARTVALETGEIQYAPFDAVSFSDVARLKQEPELVVQTDGYDFQSQFMMLEFNLKNKYLADLRVRQAIGNAINTKGLIDTVWYGLGKPATGPVPSSLTRFYNPDVQTYPYDPAAAEKLLDAAGLPRGVDGIRFHITNDYGPTGDAPKMAAEYIRQNLKAVGIDLQVRPDDMATFIKNVYADYNFDTNLGQYSPMIDPEMGLFRKLLSTNYVKGVPNMNASSYASPEMDALLKSISTEADPQARAAYFGRLQALAQKDLPFLSLTEMRHVTVYSARLHGVSKNPDGALSSFRDTWIEQ